MNVLRHLALGCVALLACGVTAVADDYPAHATATVVDPPTVAAGATTSLRVDVEVDKDFHIYGLASPSGVPTKFEAPKGGWQAGITAGKATESPAAKEEEQYGDKMTVHEGKVSFSLPLSIAADAAPGERELSFGLQLMACEKDTCRPPTTLALSVKLWITEPSTVHVVRTEFVPATVTPDSDANLEIEFAIDNDWHVYAQSLKEYHPPTFVWTPPAGWTAKGDPVETTPPHEHRIEGLDDVLLIHEGKLVLRQAFHVPADAKAGKFDVTGVGAWQRCKDALGCVDDKGVEVAASVTVGGIAAQAVDGTKPAPPLPKQADPAPKSPVGDDAPQDLGSILLSGAGWGLLTILTPCVFPLLPVTVSFFSKQKGPALPRSLVYAGGIVFTITVIGLVFKSSLDLFSRGSMFNLFVGLLFIVLALSLFGMFELRLPSFLIDKSQAKSGAGGLAGPFFMAVTLALTSFSCSVPFLAIMFSRYDKGDVAHAVLGLLAYGTTLALPFFLCSLFPTLLRTLPRSGGWLNAVKVTMGFVEFGLAFKFLRTVAINEGSDVLPRSLVLALWTACAIGAALYLFGYVVLPHDTKVESIGVVRLLFALLFLTMALYFVPGILGRPLNATLDGFIQTDESDLAAAVGPGDKTVAAIEWKLNDWDGALARAAEKKRPALFDFTGVG